jgi:hypothetical protein
MPEKQTNITIQDIAAPISTFIDISKRSSKFIIRRPYGFLVDKVEMGTDLLGLFKIPL